METLKGRVIHVFTQKEVHGRSKDGAERQKGKGF
jgi:hypothetical protein